MTDVYELDGRKLRDPEEAHAYLKELLGLPAHYGNNADALFDCLTEKAGETILWISSADEIHPKLASVLMDAMAENPGLTVIMDENP